MVREQQRAAFWKGVDLGRQMQSNPIFSNQPGAVGAFGKYNSVDNMERIEQSYMPN